MVIYGDLMGFNGIYGDFRGDIMGHIPSGYDIASSPWKDPPFLYKFGKPSISMGHGFHGYASHNQRVSLKTQNR